MDKNARPRQLLALVVLLGLIGVCAPWAVGQQPPSPPPSRIEPGAQQLLDKVIQALGGPAFLSVKRLTTRGRAFSISDESTVGVAPFENFTEYPDKRRFSYGKTKPVILINNGDQAWELDRYGLTSQLPEQVQRWKISNRYSLENLLRLRIREPGVLIQRGGVDFVDNVPTQALEIFEPGATHVTLELHPQTFLPVRIGYRVQNPKSGEWDDYSDVYGDYRSFQGVQTPLHITRFINGERVSEIFRNSAHYDDDYPASYFQPSG